MLLLYCIGEGGEKRQQQPPEQKNMYLYIVAVLDIYLYVDIYLYEILNLQKKNEDGFPIAAASGKH